MVNLTMESLSAMQGAYRGQRCFIIGTGPSLAYKNLSFLKNEHTIALNLAPLMLDRWDITPDFHIVADKDTYPLFGDLLGTLLRKETKKLVVAHACQTVPTYLQDDQTFLIPKILPQDIPRFSKNAIAEGFSRGKTVAYDAVQLAYFLGFQETYLIGVDMSTAHEWGKNGHAYEIQPNPKFPNLEFPTTQHAFIQKGVVGHPEYREFINECFALARKEFEQAGHSLINDNRSSLSTLEKKDVLKTFGNVPHVVAIVPAKGQSNRVKGKNVRELAGKPLFLHILDTLLTAYTVDEVYLDTESEEVATLAIDRAHHRIYRPLEFATNSTDGNQLLLHGASKVDADIYVQALPTAPFITRKTIDDMIFAMQECGAASAVAVTRQRQYLWNDDGTPLNYDPLHIPNSVDLAPSIIESMGLYAITREELFTTRTRVGRAPLLSNIPLLEAFDINTEEEFSIAEQIMRGAR